MLEEGSISNPYVEGEKNSFVNENSKDNVAPPDDNAGKVNIRRKGKKKGSKRFNLDA